MEDIIVISSSSSSSSQDDDPWCKNYNKHRKKMKKEIKAEKQEFLEPLFNTKRTNYADLKIKTVSNMGFVNFGHKSIFKCLITFCNFENSNENHFENHLKLHISNGVIKSKTSFCLTCNSSFNAENLLGEFHHMKKYHSMKRFSKVETAVEDQFYLNDSGIKKKTGFKEAARLTLDEQMNCFQISMPQRCNKIPPSILDEIEPRSEHENLIQNCIVGDQPTVRAFEKLSATGTTDKTPISISQENHNRTNTSEKSLRTDQHKLENMFRRLSTEKIQTLNVEDIPVFNELVQENSVEIDILTLGVDAENKQYSPGATVQPTVQQPIKVDDLKITIVSLENNFKKASVKDSPGLRSNSEPYNWKRKSDDENTSEKSKKHKMKSSMSKKDETRKKSIEPSESVKSSTPEPPKLEAEKSLNETMKPPRVYAVNEGASTSKASFYSQKSPNEKASPIMTPPPAKLVTCSELMCWKENKVLRHNTKTADSYNKMFTKSSLVNLYKCMGDDCSFTSSNGQQFFEHLCEHEHALRSRRTYFDHCPYCPFILPKERKLRGITHHIFNQHKHDVFQCSKCFYRSREKESCIEHFKLHHKQAIKKIFKCPRIKFDHPPEEQQLQKQAFENMERKRKQFVKQINCPYCKQGCYPLINLNEHLKGHLIEDLNPEEMKKFNSAVADLMAMFRQNHYGKFQCLFCEYGTTLESDISQHMIAHPSELRYCCLRQSPPYPKNALPTSHESTCIFKIGIKHISDAAIIADDCSHSYELHPKAMQSNTSLREKD